MARFTRIGADVDAFQYHVNAEKIEFCTPRWFDEAIKNEDIIKKKGKLFVNSITETIGVPIVDGYWVIYELETGKILTLHPEHFKLCFKETLIEK